MKTARLFLSWIMAMCGLLAIVLPGWVIRLMEGAYGNWLGVNHTVSQILGVYLFCVARKVAWGAAESAALHSCAFVGFGGVTLAMTLMDNIYDSTRHIVAVGLLFTGVLGSRLLARHLRINAGAAIDGLDHHQTDAA